MITAPSTVIPSSVVWRARYFERVRSPEWRQLKATLTRYRGPYCQRCGDYGVPLSLHHKHYGTMGNERACDLELLCGSCHETADRERAERGRQRAAEGIFVTGRNTFAAKKYGINWRDTHDPEEVGKEFSQWLAKKKAQTSCS